MTATSKWKHQCLSVVFSSLCASLNVKQMSSRPLSALGAQHIYLMSPPLILQEVIGKIFHKTLLYSLCSGSWIHAHSTLQRFLFYLFSSPPQKKIFLLEICRQKPLYPVSCTFLTSCLFLPSFILFFQDYPQFSKLYSFQEKREVKSFPYNTRICKLIKKFSKTKDHHPLSENHCPQKVIKSQRNQTKEHKHTFMLQIQVTFEII